MSELSEAFVYPVDRSVATAGSKMLDRISVRDYIVDVEIGAFKVEQGIKQKIKVNVVLEILPHNAFESDNVDKVISYDSLVDSIDRQFEVERVNLLETVAERIAQSCLEDIRAVRVFVRIEKLEKIPGGLGVEIVRENTQGLNKLNKVSSKRGGVGESSTIITFAENYLSLESSKLLIEKVINSDKRYIFSVSGDPFDKTYQSRNINDFYISLLRLDQIAWAFAKQHRKLLVADSRTEIDWAIKQNRIPIWAPYGMYSKAIGLPKKYCYNPSLLTSWLANETQCKKIIELRRASTETLKSERFEIFDGSFMVMSYENFLSHGI